MPLPQMGKLNIVSARERTEWLAKPVAEMLVTLSDTDVVGVTEIDPNMSDTMAFCEQYAVGLSESANCIIVEAKQGEKRWLAAVIILGNTRADINGVVRHTLGARRVSFAPMDQAVAETGMEYGAITPIGLPSDWPILIDQAVADAPAVIIGSGIRKSKLAVPGSFLSTLPNAEVIAGLANKREE